MREEQSQSHGFATRRNDAVMRSGIHARIEPATDGREATLVVTNLAGHANPTGTHRRGIRVDCWFDDSESSRRTLARWSAYPLNSGPAAGQPLAPAEERRITLPRNDQAAFVTCQVIFERNHLDPGAMEVLLAQASGRLTRPLSPK